MREILLNSPSTGVFESEYIKFPIRIFFIIILHINLYYKGQLMWSIYYDYELSIATTGKPSKTYLISLSLSYYSLPIIDHGTAWLNNLCNNNGCKICTQHLSIYVTSEPKFFNTKNIRSIHFQNLASKWRLHPS